MEKLDLSKFEPEDQAILNIAPNAYLRFAFISVSRNTLLGILLEPADLHISYYDHIFEYDDGEWIKWDRT